MKFFTAISLSFFIISNHAQCMELKQTTQKKSITRRQVGWGALGVATLCLTPALAASSSVIFIFEAAAASKGEKKSWTDSATGLVFTAASTAASVYSFWNVHRLQRLKKNLK